MLIERTMDNFSSLSKRALIVELRKYGMPVTGTKHDLIRRLESHLNQEETARGQNSTIASNTSANANIADKIREKERELAELREQQLNSTVLPNHSGRSIRSERLNDGGELGGQQPSDNRRTNTGDGMCDMPGAERNDQRMRGMHQYESPVQTSRPMQSQPAMGYGNPYMHAVGTRSLLQYRDIEGSMNTFSGEDNYRIEVWIDDFEQHAVLFQLSDFDKLILAKKLLRGAAKLLLRSIFVPTWDDLKDALENEFGSRLSSKEAHNLLKTTKKRSDQSMRDYVLRMREVGVTNKIDKESIIQYIIDGINDGQANKVMLFGANRSKN